MSLQTSGMLLLVSNKSFDVMLNLVSGLSETVYNIPSTGWSIRKKNVEVVRWII